MNRVGERYQIVIDRKVRAALGVRPGDLAVERVEDGRLVVDFIPAPHERSLFGAVRRLVDRPIEPIRDWEAAFELGWDARAREIIEEMEAGRELAEGEPEASDR